MVASVLKSTYFAGGFCIIFFGYIAQTSLLQYWYYNTARNTKGWKIQPLRTEHVGQFYWVPILSNKPNRAPMHGAIVLFNLCIASIVAGFTFHYSAHGWNHMQLYQPSTVDAPSITFQFLLAVVFENVAEYYWHRMMHTKLFYASFHKYHHWYKSPEPWDDMYIHPLEAFGYYCILYGPPFLFPIHWWAFAAYMVVMGVCGVLDHSGIRFVVPGLYDTQHHDDHHLKFDVNYAFPLPYMDLLHGTFEGEILGRHFKVRK
jgi:sterol desaturase/sphingolipid hydroxylase (fatty acid hydroxylase superfamily)